MRPRLSLQRLEARDVPAAFVPDPTFSNVGFPAAVRSEFPGGSFATVGVAPLVGGSLLVAGQGYSTANGAFVARFSADGTPDAAFDGDGVADLTIDLGANGLTQPGSESAGKFRAKAVAALPGGGVLVVGETVAQGPVLVKLTAAGSLDASFGTGGVAVLVNRPQPTVPGAYNLSPIPRTWTARVLADGKIIAASSSNYGQPANAYRASADGSLDTTYGTNGVASIGAPPGAPAGSQPLLYAAQLVIAPAGEVVAAGNFLTPIGGAAFDSTLYAVRLTAAGVPDANFGAGGFARLPAPVSGGSVEGLAVRPDGTVVVATRVEANSYWVGAANNPLGSDSLVQLTPAGATDAAFGTGGVFTLATGDGFHLPRLGGIALTEFGEVAVLLGTQVTANVGVAQPEDAADIGLVKADGSGYAAEPSKVAGPDTDINYGFGGDSRLSFDEEGLALITSIRESTEYGPDIYNPVIHDRVRVARAVLDLSATPTGLPVPQPAPVPPAIVPPVTVPVTTVIDTIPAPKTQTSRFVSVTTSNGVVTIQFGDGRTGALEPFAGFRGPLTTATGDVTGDGVADLVAAAGNGGGAVVAVYDGVLLSGTQFFSAKIAGFYGIPDENFRGGSTVALADVTGDGVADLVAAAGQGGGPRVTVWDGTKLAQVGAGAPPVSDFFAFEPSQRGGLTVAAGAVEANSRVSLVFGAGPGGGPRVRVADATSVMGVSSLDAAKPTADFFAGDPDSRGGVGVAVLPLRYPSTTPVNYPDGTVNIFAARTNGRYASTVVATAPGGPRLAYYDLLNPAPVGEPFSDDDVARQPWG